VPRLARLARRHDVVHCTMWDSSLWGRLAAIAARRPVLVADHSTDRSVQVSRGGAERGRAIALHYKLLDPFTYATVACATTQPALLESDGVSPRKIVYIPNGIPLDAIRAAATGISKADLGIPEGVPVLAQVGVFREEKNQIGGVEAFARVREALPGARLLLIGDGPTRPAVEARARELGEEGIHFLGLRRDVPALLALADLMLLPSRSDAMPMVVLEAMALGVPTVATDVGDVRWMLGDGGVCVPPIDPEAFVGAVIGLLGDEAGRARLAAAGIRSAERFDAATMAASYSTLFEAARRGTAPLDAVPDVRA
jgi:glycosyltransferase involved in cell wall biosynthesis